VYFCNPNNPSGTVHGPAAVENFVRRIMAASPATRILIDEAYINYADPALMQSALPLVKEFPNVFITRSFSKAHGIAGLRVGYGLGHADTLDAIDRAWGMGDVNMLGAIAALTAFEDTAHLEWERQENAEIRAMVTGAFRDMGFTVPDSQTNHLFVNLRRPAREFREACLERNILVGRDFPPMENTHSRISLGSREEMSKAIEVFRSVLT
jgi:histidinol-phosphate aminotransferase